MRGGAEIEAFDLQLGGVRAAYLEQSGKVSVFRFPPQAVRAGLSIEPPYASTPPPRFEAGERASRDGAYACARCARVATLPLGDVFPVDSCGGIVWLDRVASDRASAAATA